MKKILVKHDFDPNDLLVFVIVYYRRFIGKEIQKQ